MCDHTLEIRQLLKQAFEMGVQAGLAGLVTAATQTENAYQGVISLGARRRRPECAVKDA